MAYGHAGQAGDLNLALTSAILTQRSTCAVTSAMPLATSAASRPITSTTCRLVPYRASMPFFTLVKTLLARKSASAANRGLRKQKYQGSCCVSNLPAPHVTCCPVQPEQLQMFGHMMLDHWEPSFISKSGFAATADPTWLQVRTQFVASCP